MATYYSKIHVQYKDGSKPKGAKVSLGFSTGVTKYFYTDRNGTAVVAHASRGRAKVFVRGKNVGTLQAPGETVVFI